MITTNSKNQPLADTEEGLKRFWGGLVLVNVWMTKVGR